jgi:dolichyl-phosphate-mannose--protein O-mannosyl transferase
MNRAWLAILVVFVLAASPHLGYPATPVFDEVYTAPAAQEFVEGRVPHEQSHPPLSKFIMAGGYMFWMGGRFQEATTTWSPVAFAIRSPSVLAGAGCLVLLFLIGLVLLEDRRKATLAMALLAMDSLFMVMSRTAMTNIYGMCFGLLCVLGTVLAIKRRDPRWLVLAGLGLGLGGACRWTAIVSGSLCVLAVWGFLGGTRAGVREWGRWFAYGILVMGVLPDLVYLASYVPQVWMATHHDLGKVFSAKTADYLVRVHRYAVAMHTKLEAPNPDYSSWYTWPLMLKPAWFHMFRAPDLKFEGIWGIGNGLIWWATLPMLAYGAFTGLKERRRELLVPTLLVLGLWLVWAAARSPINYLHYMFEVVPFVCLLLADGLVRLWDRGLPARAAVGLYLALTAAWAVWFYPLLTAQRVDFAWYTKHMLLGANWDETQRLAAWRKEYHLEDDKAYNAFLKQWYPTADSYLEMYNKLEQLKAQRRASAQPGRSPALPPSSPATEAAPADTAPVPRP